MRTQLAAVLALPLLFSLVGCVQESAPESSPATVEKTDAIYGGTQDSTNGAVVWLYNENEGSACTGTIIAVNGSTGFILTAAHCNGMTVIVRDSDISCAFNDPSQCDDFWEVESQLVHPAWNDDPGQGHDYSVIRFIGASANTPVIPAASGADGLSAGTVVELSGYGLTNGGQETTQRRHVSVPVADLDSILIAYDQSGGQGVCSGDSGGPAIYQGKVVGVSSFVSPDCETAGYSGRVTAAYEEFIVPALNGKVQETCESCNLTADDGVCADELSACTSAQTCLDFYGCLSDCQTQACADGCTQQYPAGADLFWAYVDCGCTQCAELCEYCEGTSTGATTSAVTNGPGPTVGPGTGSGGGGEVGPGNGSGGAPPGSGSGGTSGDGGSSASGEPAEDDGGASVGCDECSAAGTSGPTGAAGIFGFFGALGAMVARRRRTTAR